MTTHNDDAVREVERQQRAARRHTTSTPRADEPTTADLTRELHYMQTQVEQYGYPGTRAVLDEIGRLRADLAKHRELLREVLHGATTTPAGRSDFILTTTLDRATLKKMRDLDQRNP